MVRGGHVKDKFCKLHLRRRNRCGRLGPHRRSPERLLHHQLYQGQIVHRPAIHAQQPQSRIHARQCRARNRRYSQRAHRFAGQRRLRMGRHPGYGDNRQDRFPRAVRHQEGPVRKPHRNRLGCCRAKFHRTSVLQRFRKRHH